MLVAITCHGIAHGWTPYDVIKQRLQVQQNRDQRTTMLALSRDIYRQHGIPGFYVGLWAGVAVWGPYSAVFFATYELARDTVGDLVTPTTRARGAKTPAAPEVPSSSSTTTSSIELLCGVCAGAVAAVVTQPLDCIKTRYQIHTGTHATGGPKVTLLSTLAEVLASRGALFRGTAARVCWLAPGSGLTITVFELVQRRLERCQ